MGIRIHSKEDLSKIQYYLVTAYITENKKNLYDFYVNTFYRELFFDFLYFLEKNDKIEKSFSILFKNIIDVRILFEKFIKEANIEKDEFCFIISKFLTDYTFEKSLKNITLKNIYKFPSSQKEIDLLEKYFFPVLNIRKYGKDTIIDLKRNKKIDNLWEDFKINYDENIDDIKEYISILESINTDDLSQTVLNNLKKSLEKKLDIKF